MAQVDEEIGTVKRIGAYTNGTGDTDTTIRIRISP